MNKYTMEDIVNFCKQYGFVFPGSEIYGGLANSYDYGPLGAELLKNIRDTWWKEFIHKRQDMVGVDTQITLNLRSRVGGLVRVERKNKRIELKIFSGDIHFPGETDKISRLTGVLIPSGTGI